MTFPPADFLDLSQTEHTSLFQDSMPVWKALKQIGDYLKHSLQPGMNGKVLGTPFIGDRIFIGSGTIIQPGATILGPAWIGNNCQIRSGCYIRENVIVGNEVVLGNSCEFKNCVIFNNAEIPHFNYVGDSILGYKAHIAAGVILSNVRLDRAEISVKYQENKIPTGLKKFGAIIGDKAEIRLQRSNQPRFNHRSWFSDLPSNSFQRRFGRKYDPAEPPKSADHPPREPEVGYELRVTGWSLAAREFVP